MKIHKLLKELEELGMSNDDKPVPRSEKLLNITRDTGEFFSVLVKSAKAQHILEVGTSNGYSTLWFASSLQESGRITTLEVLPNKIALAHQNFQKSGLGHKINLIETNAIDYFEKSNDTYDIVFLDAERTEYMKFAEQVVDAIRPGGLLICDNAISHASELEEFVAYIEDLGQFTTSTVPVGKGEYLAYKNA